MSEPKEIPVYLFAGFLEAGKTRFIQEALADERFNDGERTLLLQCEEGVEEYDPSGFAVPNVTIRSIDGKDELNEDDLGAICDETDPEMIVVEYNGMWTIGEFFEAMPESWMVYNICVFFDSETVMSYNANMRSLVVDKIQNCDMVTFNRVTDDTDKLPLHKLVRALNRKCTIMYEYTDGKSERDDTVDPLPFDVNAPVVEIEDRDYALFYSDLMENMKQYDGKTVKFRGLCANNPSLPADKFIVGRYVMTCCAADTQYCGMLASSPLASTIRDSSWVDITAKLEIRFSRIYGRKGPVLKVIKTTGAKPPAEPVATFY